MDQSSKSMAKAAKRYAVATGVNKGIVFEICRQLASNGIVVVITARDEKRGLEAAEKLQAYALSDSNLLMFHQLDVSDADSVSSLADFINFVHFLYHGTSFHLLSVSECRFFLPFRYAVVTGANKGIGLEICRQLASNGIVVILTSRDEKRGLEAVQNLISSGLSDELVVFHQLDVLDPDSVASLAEFVKSRFGKLDILANNAGINPVSFDADAFWKATDICGSLPDGVQVSRKEIASQDSDMKEKCLDTTYYASKRIVEALLDLSTQDFDLTEKCLDTNYYAAKRMVEALLPLLELSDSARIVNVSSGMGHLQNIPSEWAKGVLNDAENLSEEKIDEVVNKFKNDLKEDKLEANGWPLHISAYTISKAALNAYTRILARRFPNFRVNCVCPGLCKTDITNNIGEFTAAQGAEHPVRLALLPSDGPSGCFFMQKEMFSF